MIPSQVVGTVYVQETFDDAEWSSRWMPSEVRPEAERGMFTQTTGAWFVEESDLGIKTSEDARFYGLSMKVDPPIDNTQSDLIVSYLVKHEQNIDCGGAYLKLLKGPLDPTAFSGDSAYGIMFGPDICGSTKKTHAILNYARPKGDTEAKNMDHTSSIDAKSDMHAHLYTLILKQDNTYKIDVDGETIKEGKVEEGWPFQPAKEIMDPDQSKPVDWVDEAEMPDPEEVKPEGYDDIPSMIPDPEAKKPEDWDDEDDGEWEAPMVDNPDYSGSWKASMIPNPDYFEVDDSFHARCNPCESIGFELWQVKSGTLFDDILITDDVDELEMHTERVMKKISALKEEKKQLDAKRHVEEEKDRMKNEELDVGDDDDMDDDDMEAKDEL